MSFRVDLSIFRGPMDLLLYLVRKHEVEIVDLPVSTITEQFVEHLDVLQQLDVDAVGDFLAMASTLVEIKSRMVLPRADEVEDEIDDPRQELVLRLLEYKKIRDAASILEERSRDWQMRYPRQATDLPPRQRDLAEEQIREVELWDLVSAFGRVMRESQQAQPANIVYDETPILTYMEQIRKRMIAEGSISFSSLFVAGMHKSSLIGIFLAVLELVRHHHVQAEQGELFSDIKVVPGNNFSAPLDYAGVDDYDAANLKLE